jgi:hypothetical protein
MGMFERYIDKCVVGAIQRNKENLKEILTPNLQEVERPPEEVDQSFKREILSLDFQECMSMLRHYDTINWDLLKFAFGQVLVVLGACWTILSSVNKQSPLDALFVGVTNYVVGGVLLASALFVLLAIMAIMKNRTYFVKMSRYLNEHRCNAITNNTFGFQNKSNMWNDPQFPKIVDWTSTQLYCFYLLALCFLVLETMSLFCLTYSACVVGIALFLSVSFGVIWLLKLNRG